MIRLGGPQCPRKGLSFATCTWPNRVDLSRNQTQPPEETHKYSLFAQLVSNMDYARTIQRLDAVAICQIPLDGKHRLETVDAITGFIRMVRTLSKQRRRRPSTDLFVGIGQLRYRLDDGRTLTQHEFDQLPDLR
jgi:hypothetical protein